MFDDLWNRIRALLRWRRAERDLHDELQFHQLQEREKSVQRGVDPATARRQARIAFGGTSAAEEACRDERGVSWLTDAAVDLRYSWRGLIRAPLFTTAVVGSLVLGIGVNATLFTVMRAALWRPLPVPASEEIVHVRRTNKTVDADMTFSYLLLQELRTAMAPGARVVAKTTARVRKFGVDPASRERVTGEAVSADFFSVLGVAPAAGRLFAPDDDSTAGGQRVAVFSDAFWARRFGRDPAVIGQTIYYEETPFTIVGVAGRGFSGVEAEMPVDVWLPVTADPTITPDWLKKPGYYWLTLLARVPDASRRSALRDAADSRFQVHLEQDLLPGVPTRFRSQVAGQHIELRPAAAGIATTGRSYAEALRVLTGVALCILLICGVNVANLVRARQERRRPEFAVRRALGASPGRLFRQQLFDGLALAGLGTAGAILAAPSAAALLVRLLPQMRLAFDLRADAIVLVMAAAIGLVGAVVAIAWPAWHVTSQADMNVSGVRVTRGLIAGRSLVVTELSTVLVLLVVAGLCLTTVRRLHAIGLGFDAKNVTSVHLSVPKGTADTRARLALEDLRRRLNASPGVEVATYAFPDVYDRGGSSMAIVPDGYTSQPGEDTLAGTLWAGPGIFDVLRLQLKEGRFFDENDLAARARAVVVNEKFARYYFGDRSAVGQTLRVPSPTGGVVQTVIGVVNDARHYGARWEPWKMVYFPTATATAHLLIRGHQGVPPEAAIRSAVEGAGLHQVENIQPLADAVNRQIGTEQLMASLSTTVALIASLLAAFGLYGVVAYGVACRSAEFGVRLALGARPLDLQRLVLGETLKLVAVGTVIGLAAATFASKAISAVIEDSAALNIRIALAAAGALVIVAAAACVVPAWRAARTDPANTLRSE